MPGFTIQEKPIVPDTSGSVIAYHKAIAQSGRQIRLDISSNVCRNDTFLDIWEGNSDTMRLEIDINNQNSGTLVGMWKIQGTIEQYRRYINQIVDSGKDLRLRPDFSNLFVGNEALITGINDLQRTSVMSHWIGAAANLILGSDMTRIDDHGKKLLTSKGSRRATEFCGQYPMQPRNPGNGSSTSQQRQAWVCGPSKTGEAYVLLTNYGPNQGRGGFESFDSGDLLVRASLEDLSLTGKSYRVHDVWSDASYKVLAGDSLNATLAEGAAEFLRLTSDK